MAHTNCGVSLSLPEIRSHMLSFLFHILQNQEHAAKNAPETLLRYLKAFCVAIKVYFVSRGLHWCSSIVKSCHQNPFIPFESICLSLYERPSQRVVEKLARTQLCNSLWRRSMKSFQRDVMGFWLGDETTTHQDLLGL